MGTDNLNNRISVLTPELIAKINSDMTAAVREVADQYLDALKKYPEELLAAHEEYFGTR